MKYVNQILQSKGYDVWAVSPEASVCEALKLMQVKNVGALMVMKDGKPVGIFSERDWARRSLDCEKTPRQTLISELMAPRIIYVTPDETVEECMALMTDKCIRHLPVMQDDNLIGIISIGDVIKSLISDKDFVIGQLERYITSAR